MPSNTDLQACLANFRPSDRAALDRLLAEPTGRDIALAAVKDFVERWEKADWLDEGSLERVGRWFGNSQPTVISGALQEWAGGIVSAARGNSPGTCTARRLADLRTSEAAELALSSSSTDAVSI